MSNDPFGTEFPDPTKVRRAKDGRPYIKLPCPDASMIGALMGLGCVEGRVPGARPGKTKQCPKCKGQGYLEKLYTRCTTFIGALESREQLEAWRERVVLTGLALDWRKSTHEFTDTLWDELSQVDAAKLDAAFAAGDDPFAESARTVLSRIARRAFEVGDGHAKAQRGTDLHKLTEYVDAHEPLPDLLPQEVGPPRPVTLQDRADLAAYVRLLEDLHAIATSPETFVVNDDWQAAGTFDRLLSFATFGAENIDMHPCPERCQRPVVGDVKSGRVDYGAGKMGQQLAMYANSKRYDPETGERTELGACKHVGIILHVAQGTGEAEAYTVDLVEGYAAVALSAAVRAHRRDSKHWLRRLGGEPREQPSSSLKTHSEKGLTPGTTGVE
jgi:hypothetical protein